jgi:structural maintenance of chromosomes protein 6
LQREIDECQRHIDEELAKTQPDRAELENKQAQIAQQIKEKEEEIRRVEDELHTAVTSRNGSGALKEQLRREAEELHQKKDTLNRAIYDLKEGITQAEHAAKNELNRFGRRIPEILKAIDGTSWTGAKPIGPLGRYVKLRPNCGGYADIMKTQIGRTMFAFVVENGRDREQLLRILKAHGKYVLPFGARFWYSSRV